MHLEQTWESQTKALRAALSHKHYFYLTTTKTKCSIWNLSFWWLVSAHSNKWQSIAQLTVRFPEHKLCFRLLRCGNFKRVFCITNAKSFDAKDDEITVGKSPRKALQWTAALHTSGSWRLGSRQPSHINTSLQFFQRRPHKQHQQEYSFAKSSSVNIRHHTKSHAELHSDTNAMAEELMPPLNFTYGFQSDWWEKHRKIKGTL